jgi:hypothetical protein
VQLVIAIHSYVQCLMKSRFDIPTVTGTQNPTFREMPRVPEAPFTSPGHIAVSARNAVCGPPVITTTICIARFHLLHHAVPDWHFCRGNVKSLMAPLKNPCFLASPVQELKCVELVLVYNESDLKVSTTCEHAHLAKV